MDSTPLLPEKPRQIIAATVVAVTVIAGFGVAYLLSNAMFLLFIGIVLATTLKPIITAIQRHGVPQPIAVGGAYAGVILLLAIVIILGAPYVTGEVKGLLREAPRAGQQAQRWLDHAGDALWANIVRRLVADLSLAQAPAEMEQALATVGRTASYLATIAHGLLAVCVALLLSFYWSLQKDRTIRWFLLLLPLARREGARDTLAEIEGKVGAYIRGQGLVCLAMAGMAMTVYGLLGLRYAVVLGLLAGLLEVVPVFGPILGAIPPLVVALFTAAAKTPWVLLAAILMQQAENYLLLPPIMDRSVGVHPMVTLLALVAFSSLWGIPGAILAIPLAVIVQVLLNRYVLGPAAGASLQPSRRGASSVLRYQAQELLRDIRLRHKAEPEPDASGHLEEAVEAIARDLDASLQAVEDGGVTEGES